MNNFSHVSGFSWDKGNLLKNWVSHKVMSSEAEEIFFNKPLKFLSDIKHSSQTEIRFQALGKSDRGRFLCVIFTVRLNKFRIISARDMSKKERSFYHET